MFGKRKEEQLNDAYDSGFSTGLELGYIAAETRIKNYIAQIGEMDWLLDELDMITGPQILKEDDFE
jgi:hypothetical protein